MSTSLPIQRHIRSPFEDPTFLANYEAADLLLKRRCRGIETDILTLQAAAIDPTAPDPATGRIAYRLLVRCSILASMNLTGCEDEALEESFVAMREQADRGDDRLAAFQGHIDTVIAASHMSEARKVLPMVWRELGPFIRLLTDQHWPIFLRVVAWCSAENFWDDRTQICSNIRLLRQMRPLTGDTAHATS